jgi:hypothetical protein
MEKDAEKFKSEHSERASAIVEYVASAETETAEKKTNNEPSTIWFWGLLIVLVAGLGFVLVRKDNK